MDFFFLPLVLLGQKFEINLGLKKSQKLVDIYISYLGRQKDVNIVMTSLD